jgi:hypothetical protein
MGDPQRARDHYKWADRYMRYGDTQKAAAHMKRALHYAPKPKSRFGTPGSTTSGNQEGKTHRIFVLSPLNDAAEEKLNEMVNDASGQYGRIEVYIQGFSEPQMHPVCGTEEGNWKDKGCTNILPAQFNQYCSDSPLALVNLINRHSASKKVKFVIMPTQLTKNGAFSNAVIEGHKTLLPAKWDMLDMHTKRKIASWHGIAPAEAELPSTKASLMHADMKFKTLFDPFVAYMIGANYDGLANKTSLSRLDVEVDANALGMPTMRARGAGSAASNVELVFHENVSDAALDGAAYAQYVWNAITSEISWRRDDAFVNSVLQDWSDWDNLLSVRCILATLSGDLTLYSIGRPVGPKCAPDFYAKYEGGLHMWPPCRTGEVIDVDVTRSTEEAIDVATTWYKIMYDWMRKDYKEPSEMRPTMSMTAKPVRGIFVANYGFTKRHGINPALHSPIVDIYSVHPERYELDKGAYVGLENVYFRETFAKIGNVAEVGYYG